jgi:predicted RNA-binding Zn-ribbon protein involved in translation (DUF1610 family)
MSTFMQNFMELIELEAEFMQLAEVRGMKPFILAMPETVIFPDLNSHFATFIVYGHPIIKVDIYEVDENDMRAWLTHNDYRPVDPGERIYLSPTSEDWMCPDCGHDMREGTHQRRVDVDDYRCER